MCKTTYLIQNWRVVELMSILVLLDNLAFYDDTQKVMMNMETCGGKENPEL